jgi:GPH family glycoside/pentoside/hexuronide:cation symporter
LLYYTDVLGLAPATAGWIFAAALAWDAVTDPVMGYIASRTRTRWGRYRPYLLFGAVPLAASWALIFLPTGFTGTALTLFALAAHMLFRTCYTVVSMPYVSLSAVMTSDSHERGVLAGFRMVAATGGGADDRVLHLEAGGAARRRRPDAGISSRRAAFRHPRDADPVVRLRQYH